MRVRIVTPAPARSRKGNRVTALRWARILRGLGHRVVVEEEYRNGGCDLLVALHARRSLPSIERFRARFPALPLVVALTGTDLHHDLEDGAPAREALAMASRLVLLQPLGIDELPREQRRKARVILQSAKAPARRPAPARGTFDVCVVGHLRPVKDPFRAARAARRLPPESVLRVLHAGAALCDSMERQARAEEAANPRYRWLGEIPRWRTMRLLARSRLLVHSSRAEGGANVISEALAASVPILSSRIPGSVGILGEDHPGWFPVGDTAALAELLERAENDEEFHRRLRSASEGLAHRVDPERERRSWEELLRELNP